jgi:hypothetical protein
MDRKAIVLYLQIGRFLSSVKRDLTGYHAGSLSGLVVRIQVILRASPGETFVKVFIESMKRLQSYIDMNREYVA